MSSSRGERRLSIASARRPVLAAAALYALLALLFVGQALTPGRTLSNSDSLYFVSPWSASRPADLQRPSEIGDEFDWPVQYDTWLRYDRAEFPGIPLWNPYVMSGRPYIGNAQSAAFSIFTLPAYVLPYELANGLTAALKLFLAALGTFLLARALGLAWAGAFLSGLVFAFGMPLVTWLLEANLSAVWSLIPWLLLATRSVIVRPGVLPVAGLAATAAVVFLAAHPESIIQAFAGATAFLVLLMVRKQRATAYRARGWALDVGRFGGGVLWGAAIAAVAIVPFVELLVRSSDIAERGTVGHHSLSLHYLITLVLPDYWGRGTGYPVGLQALGRFLYIGALPLILAAVALLRPKVERAAFAAFGVACIAVAFGVPPFKDVANVLPGLSKTDNSRLVIVGLPALALLAGWGLDDLRQVVPSRRYAAAVLAVAAVLLALPMTWLLAARPPLADLRPALRVAWRMATPPQSADVIRFAALVLWLTMAVVAVVLITLRIRTRLAPALFSGLALTLVAVDLFRAGVGFNPAITRNHATPPVTDAISYLQSRRPARFAALGTAFPVNLALRYRLYDARGYDFPIERRYHDFWLTYVNPIEVIFAGNSAPLVVSAMDPTSVRALGFLGVADILVPPDSPPPRAHGLTLAYRGQDAVVYANRRVLPRAFVVAGQTIVSGEKAALAAVGSAAFDARRTVIREGSSLSVAAAPPPGRARLVSYQPDRVVIAASSSRPATVVLSDLWFPGWSATVDGAAAQVERVDYLFRGIRVGPGAHRLVLSYRPVSWTIGRLVSGVAVLTLVVVVGAAVARRRRTPPARP